MNVLGKRKIKVEDFLCLLIIICPILDIISFVFRNIFDTSISPSTFLRPIIPIGVMIYLFFKKDKKFKIYTIGVGIIYLVYGLIHLYIFEKLKTGISYSNVIHEAQYVVNYSFMILNLFLFIYLFKDKDTKKLKNSVIISMYIYIISIYLAVLTNTSSSTYIEGIGEKGWFATGNSIGSIMILSLFIYIPLLTNNKYRKVLIPLIILLGIYLTMLLGTRVGLFGFILVLILYIVVEIVYKLIVNDKINKKTIAICTFGICTIILVTITIGSTTLQRRRHLACIEGNTIDENINSESHVTANILRLRNQIIDGTLEENYMSDAEKESILELYDICNKMEITNNDLRSQQLIYNAMLVKNQKDLIAIIFGNGYFNNFSELLMEMEIPSFLFNFGLLGFTLYFVPFLLIFVYCLYIGIKNMKKIDQEYMMLILGAGFVFALSFLTGYTFFNASSMIIIVIINTLLICKMRELKNNKSEK